MSVVNLNLNNFKEISNTDKPILIDFWASWCGPCRMQGPIIENLAEEMGDEAVITKLNVDENGELASRFSVMSIPTLLIIKNDKIVERIVGLTQKEKLVSILNGLTDVK